MSKNILGEYRFFRSQSLNIRTLLVTNMLYALILPIIEIFVGAYIMRNTGSPAYVAIYQLCMYFGVLVTSVLNGFLLTKFSASKLYAFGILLWNWGCRDLYWVHLPDFSGPTGTCSL